MELQNTKFPLIVVLFASLFLNIFLILKPRLPFSFLKTSSSLSTGIVSRIVDGDTFDLKGEVRIRLAGANTPEYPKDCLSLEAKNRLEELILGKQITFKVVEVDNFSRQVAYVFYENVLIDKVLVEEGLAQATTSDPEYDPQLLSAQDEAKSLQKGIWSSLCQAKENCLIKGNVRKDKNTKIYHLPECYNYPKIVVKETDGDRWFCSEKEALEAGFSRSQDCP